MQSLNLLIKPASGHCDMRCVYCFYEDVSDRREEKNRGMMSLETLEQIVKSALTTAEVACTFGFQGGEPTLAGLPFFQTLMEFERRHNTKNIKISNTIQTNGLRIDEAWASFLAKNDFLTGLSIDGQKEVHDRFRLDAAGKGTFNRSLRAAQILKAHSAQFNVLSVVTKPMAAHPDATYNFYRKNGLDFIQFIPCMDELDAQANAHRHSLDAQSYGRFIAQIFDLWYADFQRGNAPSIRLFDNYIGMLMGYPPESCAMRGQCTASLLIEADGDVFPCDFYALDEYKMGNIKTDAIQDMLTSVAANNFIAPSLTHDPACQACPYFKLCRGGCRRDREVGGQLTLNRYCEAYKTLFTHALPRMMQIARVIGGRR